MAKKACAFFLLAITLGSANVGSANEKQQHPISQLIILTQGRSGSTFVGELVSKISGALYLYEPCRSLTMTIDENEVTKFTKVDEQVCQTFVGRLLDCSITLDDAEKLFMDWVAITKCNVRAVVDLAPKRVTVEAKVRGYNALCAKATIRVVKEIRLVTPGPVLTQRKSAAILHLVRDVRAVVNSRVRLEGFCLHKGAPGCAKPVCDEMAASFAGMQALRSSPRYRLVRFEDVCDAPLATAKAIYGWLGYSLDAAAEEWVETSTHASKSPEGPGKYGTARADPGAVAHGWEKSLGVPEIVKINKLCGSILHSLGYEVEAVVQRAERLQAAGAAVAKAGGTAADAADAAAKEPWWKKQARKNKEVLAVVAAPAASPNDAKSDPEWKKHVIRQNSKSAER